SNAVQTPRLAQYCQAAPLAPTPKMPWSARYCTSKNTGISSSAINGRLTRVNPSAPAVVAAPPMGYRCQRGGPGSATLLPQPGDIAGMCLGIARGLHDHGGARLAHERGEVVLRQRSLAQIRVPVGTGIEGVPGVIDVDQVDDSRDAFDSGTDRHANLGEGSL